MPWAEPVGDDDVGLTKQTGGPEREQVRIPRPATDEDHPAAACRWTGAVSDPSRSPLTTASRTSRARPRVAAGGYRDGQAVDRARRRGDGGRALRVVGPDAPQPPLFGVGDDGRVDVRVVRARVGQPGTVEVAGLISAQLEVERHRLRRTDGRRHSERGPRR